MSSDTVQIPNDGLTPQALESLEESARVATVKAALRRLGVASGQVEQLVNRFPLTQIEQQLAWLPHRRARKPSSLIVAAIKERYEQPAALEAAASSSSLSLGEQKPKK